MKKKKILRIIAMFMINIIVFLPVAYADLTNPKVYGEDLVEGYARSDNESLTFAVNVEIDNKTIEAEQVRLWGNSYDTGFAFTGCGLADDNYYCSLEGFSAKENHVDICPMYSNKINLYDDEVLYDSTDVIIYCDSTKPIINSSKADKTTYTAEDVVNLSFTITDKADVSDSRRCIGIMGAVIELGEYSETIEIYTQPGDCEYSGSIEIESSSIGEGTNRARLSAYDNFGNTNYKEINFWKDENPPEISNLVITDEQGKDIEEWITGVVNAIVYVDIMDDNEIDVDSVKADLSSLNANANYKELRPSSCSKRINGSRCRWNVQISLDESKSASLIFEASDESGNNAIGEASYSFKVDNTGPIATEIKTNFVYGEEYYREKCPYHPCSFICPRFLQLFHNHLCHLQLGSVLSFIPLHPLRGRRKPPLERHPQHIASFSFLYPAPFLLISSTEIHIL